MKKFLVIIQLVILCLFPIYSQKKGLISTGGSSMSVVLNSVSLAYCFGDVGGSYQKQFLNCINDWDISNTRYLVSLGLRQLFKKDLGYEINVLYGSFVGDDANSRNEMRDYSYKNKVVGFSLQAEYVILGGFDPYKLNLHTLYIYLGGGILNSDSKLWRKGLSISETPSDRPYDKVKLTDTTPIIPVGIGYQYHLTSNFSIGAELGWIYSFSDYLDGIITQYSKRKDTLANLNITFTYKFKDTLTLPCHCLSYEK